MTGVAPIARRSRVLLQSLTRRRRTRSAWIKRLAGRGARAGLTALGALLAVLATFLTLDLAFPPPLHRAAPVSLVVTDHGGRVLRAFPVEDGRWRLAADSDRLDPRLIAALIAMEDKRFHAHAGVDVWAAFRAGRMNLAQGRVISGASTITMQTARLLEPRDRTLSAKALQMARALQLERRLTKQDILEMYLTLAPYGGNIEGVRAASWAYFHREPTQLTWAQIALLIALPQSPEARRPDLRPDAAIAARNRVLDRLAVAGLITQSQADEEKSTPAPSRRAFPETAWHAADHVRRLHAGHADHAGHAEQGQNNAPSSGQPWPAPLWPADVATTLDIRLQTRVEALARARAEADTPQTQVAILVVDVDGGQVRASVGSAGRDRPGGWLDLTGRPRSPGSTLKPIIYAMAFDDGIAAAHTQLLDAPQRFGGYMPNNFDANFHGDVTASQALRHSLNVPAVALLDQVGAQRFTSRVAAAGANVQMRQNAGTGPGLATALGGLGLSAQDLAVLYTALANGGRATPLVWRASQGDSEQKSQGAAQHESHHEHQHESQHESQIGQMAPISIPGELSGYRLTSPQAAADVLDILRRGPTPAGRAPAALTRDAPIIAYKTGTSYGYRDTWAVGVSGRHVVVVWIGRADGAAQSRRTARAETLPTLFDVFDVLAALRMLREDDQGTNQAGGNGSMSSPRSNRASVARPPTAGQSTAGQSTAGLPTAGPLAVFDRLGGAPEILFPPHGGQVLMHVRDDGSVRPFVLSGRGEGGLSWYVDGEPAAVTELGRAVWAPRGAGFYDIQAIDAAGRTQRANVRVVVPGVW